MYSIVSIVPTAGALKLQRKMYVLNLQRVILKFTAVFW